MTSSYLLNLQPNKFNAKYPNLILKIFKKLQQKKIVFGYGVKEVL